MAHIRMFVGEVKKLALLPIKEKILTIDYLKIVSKNHWGGNGGDVVALTAWEVFIKSDVVQKISRLPSDQKEAVVKFLNELRLFAAPRTLAMQFGSYKAGDNGHALFKFRVLNYIFVMEVDYKLNKYNYRVREIFIYAMFEVLR